MFFCINILIFQVLLWWESASLKSSYTCIYVLYVHICTQICIFVCKLIYANTIFFPSIVQAEVLAAPYARTLTHPGSIVFHWSQGAVGLPSPLTPCSAEDCPGRPHGMSSVMSGHNYVLGGWDQQPPCSDPPCLFSTRFALWLKHQKRSTGLVLNLCPSPKLQQSLKKCFWRPLCVCFSNNRTNRSHS